MTSTQSRQFVRAPRARVYAALTEAGAVALWMVPDGVTGIVHEFDAREGGQFRVSLTHAAPAADGQPDAHPNTCYGRFARLVPDELVVLKLAFESADPRQQGVMTATVVLTDDAGGTTIDARHDNLPPGIDRVANERDWRIALGKLKALVEAVPG